MQAMRETKMNSQDLFNKALQNAIFWQNRCVQLEEIIDMFCDDAENYAAQPKAEPVQEPTDWRTPILDAIDKRCKAAQPKAEP